MGAPPMSYPDQYNAVTVTIPGKPCHQKRHRNTKGGHYYNPSAPELKTIAHEIHGQARAQKWRRTTKPVIVRLDCHFARPKSREKLGEIYHAQKPDLDNIAKLYIDAAIAGDVIADDKQVVRINAAKYYTLGGEAPHVRLEIFEATHA
jgi:Holliday junction resolvase RusA-like endonuclease